MVRSQPSGATGDAVDHSLPIANPPTTAARSSRWDRWNEIPSWLVSLMLHVSLFLILTSFLTPQGTGGSSGGAGQIQLTIGMSRQGSETPGSIQSQADPTSVATPGDGEAPPSDEPLSTPDPSSTEKSEDSAANKSESREMASGERSSVSEPRVARREPNTSGAVRRNTNSRATRYGRAGDTQAAKAQESAVLADYLRWAEEAARDYQGPAKSSKYAALLNRIRPASSSRPIHPGVRSLERITEYVDPKQQAYDKIVDDFIAYDIGQLRGTSGQRALNRFQALGADAVPALVRGLNKSAGIHASCPVGVIAGKLMNTLHLSKDPTLRAYALDHIGVDVPESAPHYQRLLAMRKAWLNGPAMPPQVVKVLEKMQTGQDGELMELMLAISDAPSDTAIAALESGDTYLASAAALAAMQGRAMWPVEQRARVGYALHRLASTTSDEELRSLARAAHAALRQ